MLHLVVLSTLRAFPYPIKLVPLIALASYANAVKDYAWVHVHADVCPTQMHTYSV